MPDKDKKTVKANLKKEKKKYAWNI